MTASHRLDGQRVPAGEGRWFRVARGQRFDIVLPVGPQVVDLWAFSAEDPREYLSVEHCRMHWGRVAPRPGDELVTNARRPLLRLVNDSSGGAHDTLLPACDPARYALLGHAGQHRSCAANLSAAMRCAGLPASSPNPLNLFENTRLEADGCITIVPPLAGAGARVRFEALRDTIIVLSACPQDLLPTNGADMTPKPVDVRLHEPA